MAYMSIFPEWAHFPKWNRFDGAPFTGKVNPSYSAMTEKNRIEVFRQGTIMKTPQPQGLGAYDFKKAMMINPMRIKPARLNTKGFAQRAKLMKLQDIGIIGGEVRGQLPGYVTNVSQIAGFDEVGLGAFQKTRSSVARSFGGRSSFGMMQHRLGPMPTSTTVFIKANRPAMQQQIANRVKLQPGRIFTTRRLLY